MFGDHLDGPVLPAELAVVQSCDDVGDNLEAGIGQRSQ